MGRIKEISRKPARNRKRNPVVYLICEGSETEIRYFKRFRSRGCNIDIIPISSQYKSADRLVQKAKATMGNNPYYPDEGDSIWCVFDRDDNSNEVLLRAKQSATKEYDLPAIDDRLRGNYLLYGSRRYELKHPPRQYTPKRYRPKDGCAGKGVLRIFFEVFFGESQIHRLYLYYCYQLGILPKKQQPRINRPELERIWKDTEKILAEHAFVHDHKFPSLQAIVDYRKSLSRQMESLTAQRAEVVKQMRRKDAPPELADQRMALTCKIAELRKEDKIAEGAIKRIQRTRESNRIDRENRMPQHPRPRRRRRERERE